MPPFTRPRPLHNTPSKYDALLTRAVGPPTPTVEDLLGDDADDEDDLFVPPRSIRSGKSERKVIQRRSETSKKLADEQTRNLPAASKRTKAINTNSNLNRSTDTSPESTKLQPPAEAQFVASSSGYFESATARATIFTDDSISGTTAGNVTSATDEASPLLFEFVQFVQQKLSEYVPVPHDQLLAVHHVNYLVMTAVGFYHNDVITIVDALKYNADPFNGIFARQASLVAIQRFFHKVIIELHDYIPRVEAARLAANLSTKKYEPIPIELFDKLTSVTEAYEKVFHIYHPSPGTATGRRSFFYETMAATTGIIADMYHLHDRLLCLQLNANWDVEQLPQSLEALRATYFEFKSHLARERYNASHHIVLATTLNGSNGEASKTATVEEMDEHCVSLIDGLMMNSNELNSVHVLVYSIHPAIRDWLCMMQAGTSEDIIDKISVLQRACERIIKRVLLYEHTFCKHRKPLKVDHTEGSDAASQTNDAQQQSSPTPTNLSQAVLASPTTSTATSESSAVAGDSSQSSSSTGSDSSDTSGSSSTSDSDDAECIQNTSNHAKAKKPEPKRRRCFHTRFNHIIHLMCLFCDAISLWLRFFACQNAMHKSMHDSNKLLVDEYEDVECDEQEQASLVGAGRYTAATTHVTSTTAATELANATTMRSVLWEVQDGVIVTK